MKQNEGEEQRRALSQKFRLERIGARDGGERWVGREFSLHGLGCEFGDERSRCIDRNGRGAVRPHGKVRVIVARVDETAFTESVDEGLGLVGTPQVQRRRRGHDIVEEANVCGDVAGNALVRGGDQNDRPPPLTLRLEICAQ